MDWQSITAAAIVILTLTIFIIRLVIPRSGNACGKNCGCGKKSSKSV